MIETILGLIKISLEIYQSETKDKYLKKYLKIKEEYQRELNKGRDNWSDLKLIKLLDDAEKLGQLVITERSNKKP